MQIVDLQLLNSTDLKRMITYCNVLELVVVLPSYTTVTSEHPLLGVYSTTIRPNKELFPFITQVDYTHIYHSEQEPLPFIPQVEKCYV
jgi:hypothetical protein